jgi:dienelactone hydrolase
VTARVFGWETPRWRLILAGGALAALWACAGPAAPSRADLERQAGEARFTRLRLDAADMTVIGWLGPNRAPAGDRTQPLTVFVEGDGAAWPRRDRPPADPTPSRPQALGLALASTLPHVAALARPCQFERPASCRIEDWTTERFSDTAVRRMNAALNDLKSRTGADHLVLVGYSGGAHLAARLAVLRDDVGGLITVAGVLDPADWARHHRVTALPTLDRRTSARLAALPQVHVLGADDEIVPAGWARGVLDRLGGGAPARAVRVVEDADHGCCWVTLWPTLEPWVWNGLRLDGNRVPR